MLFLSSFCTARLLSFPSPKLKVSAGSTESEVEGRGHDGIWLLTAHTDPSQKPELDHSTDLTALIRQTPEDQSGVYTHALQILSSFQASPSCHRLAASTLLDSCHSIDGSKHDATASLEHSRSIYAAQLAMCEIASAEATIPQSCSSLALISEPKSYRTLSSKSVRKDQLSQCLQALEARPQWWTSYSNSRQNAVVMCQAARVDIEKGKRRIISDEM